MKTEQERIRESALGEIAKLGGMLTGDDDVVFSGRRYTLPETTDLRGAIEFLNEKLSEDRNEISLSQTYKFRPYDGALATRNALRKAFGITTQRATQGMFGPTPPRLISVPTGPKEDDTEQVPWGSMGVAGLPSVELQTGTMFDAELGPLFTLTASCRHKDRHHVQGIFRLVEEELRTYSMYRGKAIDGQSNPSFLDLSGVDASKVIYSDEVMIQLEANLWSLLRWPDQLESQGVSMKRAVLLEGPYGSGKTLAAYLTAKEAVASGVTFIYCRPGKDDLATVMTTARLYEPSVVFFEDVDVVASSQEEHDRVSEMLDAFDGLRAKGTRIIAVLTTNHVDQLHKGMMRPGRLDAVIHIGAMDDSGVMRMVQSCIPEETLSNDIDYEAVVKAFNGFLPAFAREAIDRAIRYSVARNNGVVSVISTEDLVNAALGLRPQLALMTGAKEAPERDELAGTIGKIVEQRVTSVIASTQIQDEDDGYHRYDLVPIARSGRRL